MKFFSKKKKDDEFRIEEDIPAFTLDVQEKKEEPASHHSPNVLTPEEILGIKDESEPVYEDRFDGASALDALKKRVAAVADGKEDLSDEMIDEVEIESQKEGKILFDLSDNDDIDDIILSLGGKNDEENAESRLDQKDEGFFTFNFDEPETNLQEKQDEKPVQKPQSKPEKEEKDFAEFMSVIVDDTYEEVPKPSLLDKCQPYIVDENGGEVVETEPLYKLESVAEILKSNSEKFVESLTEKYDISFDDLGYKKPEQKKEEVKESKSATAVKTDVAPKKPEIRFEEKPKTPVAEKDVFEDTLPIKNQVKNVQSNVPSVISDIDIPEISLEEPKNKDISNTATITFTPVSDGGNSGSHISVSTQTRPIDLTGELVKMPDSVDEVAEEKLKLEENEFEEYKPKEEINDEKDAARFIRIFSIKRRRSFLQTVVSFLFTAILLIAKLPFLSETLLAHTAVGMIICSSITGIIILANCDMFLALPKAFGNKCSGDALAAIASIVMSVYAVLSIIAGNVIVDMLLFLSVILSVRALSRFFRNAYRLSNLKIITQNGQKRGLKLIDDNAVTFAMAKNAIEGDVLIAAPQKAKFFSDYMKYSTYGETFGGKLSIVTYISLLLSLIVGITCGFYFDGVVYGFYAAAAIQCFAALPTLFLLDNLPLYRTAKKLNRKGAMICGKISAQQIENANAAVLSAADIFPSGTVTLHQMQVLADNDVEDTIIRAASLTESMNSPLAPIFKKIAGTGNITVFPDSDTVKYEDTMGISGWVDNRLLFIGNRTLMEAHGIEVPSVEVDRKILMQGFFPVYVATRDKACALLVIQYNVDTAISNELRRLTNLGVTLLVNSSDPNLTEEMICDYMGLYEDSVKVMSAAGCHMYKNAVAAVPKVSAPAVFRSNPIALISIINCASKIKRSNLLLTIVYLICACLGAIIFAYMSLSGSGNLIGESTLLIYGLVSTAVSVLAYFIERP